MKILPMPRDGSCLFHAFSKSLGVTVQGLRNLCAEVGEDDLIAGQPFRIWLGEDTLEEYRRLVVSPHYWGSALEIAIFVERYRLQVNVYQRDESKIVLSHDHPEQRIDLLFRDDHYDLLI